MAFRSVFVVKVCSQLALTSSGSLPVRFRVFLMLCWLTFPFIRPFFFSNMLLYFSRLHVPLWTSWVRVWGWVSDRVIIDPLFVRMSHVLFAFIFRWARGARVSNGLFPFYAQDNRILMSSTAVSITMDAVLTTGVMTNPRLLRRKCVREMFV